MTAFTSPSTWTATTLTAAQLNEQIRDNMKNVDERLTASGITSPSAINKVKSARCGVDLSNSTDPAAAASADKTLLWDGETFDTDGFHSNVSNTHRITIPSGLDGDYMFSVAIEIQASSTGDRYLWLEDSGGSVLSRIIVRGTTSSNRNALVLTVPIFGLAAGDWVAAHAMQDSAGSLDIYQNITRAGFSAYRIFAA